MARYEASVLGPIRQGEIISGLPQVKLDLIGIEAGEYRINLEVHPFVIVTSQDCDLNWDYQAAHGEPSAPYGSQVPNILCCMAIEADKLRQNSQLNSSKWRRVIKDDEERYQIINEVRPEEDAVGSGLPQLGVDFKRYFTVPAEEMYFRLRSGEAVKRCKMVSPFLEYFIRRFNNYQSRIALPFS